MMPRVIVGLCVFAMSVAGPVPARADDPGRRPITAEVEEGVGRFAADPPLFSPVASPLGWKNYSDVRLKMARRVPIAFRIVSGEKVVRAVPARAVDCRAGDPGNRFRWDGRSDSGDTLPDGAYEVQAWWNVLPLWRRGAVGGDRRGVLIDPHSLAVTGSADILVACRDNPIQQFLPMDGRFLRFWPAGFNHTRIALRRADAIAVGGDEHLVALSIGRLYRLGKTNTEPALLVDLRRSRVRTGVGDQLAVAPDGRIYLAALREDRVHVFGADGAPQDGHPGDGAKWPRFSNLAGLDVATDGRVYVADAPDHRLRVQVFSGDGKRVRLLKIPASAAARRGTAAAGPITVLSDGQIVMAAPRRGSTSSTAAFTRFSAEGKVLATWGACGAAPEAFAHVTALAATRKRMSWTVDGRSGVVEKDTIIAADAGGHNRIVMMNRTGTVLLTIATPPGRFVEPIALVRTAPDRLLVADRALNRCVLLDNAGETVGGFRLAASGITGLPDGLFAWPGGLVCVPQGAHLHVLRPDGAPVEVIRLHGGRGAFPPTVGGVLAVGEGRGRRILVSEKPTGGHAADRGVVRLYGGDGTFIRRIGEPGKSGCFGPMVAGKDGVVLIQCGMRDDRDRPAVGVAYLDVAEGRERRRVRLQAASGASLAWSAPFGGDAGRLVKAGTNGVSLFDGEGRRLWTLGPGRGGPALTCAAICLAGDRLACSYARAGCTEVWRINQEKLIGRTAVTIDRTPPAIDLEAPKGPVTSGDAVFSLPGQVRDEHFGWYIVSYRAMGEGGWRRVQRERFRRHPAPGTLARWTPDRRSRDAGLEVMVEAWDEAGNANRAVGRLDFDDDGDGLTNAEEVALGTDPREATRRGGAVRIQTGLDLLLSPYLAGGRDHRLDFAVYDVSDTADPRRLGHARIELTATSGRFMGDRTKGDTTSLTRTSGAVTWTAPAVSMDAPRTVTFTATFKRGGVDNVLYEAAEAALEVRVRRDDDDDRVPDSLELAAGDDGDTGTFRGNPDSDGDGVPDGLDRCPRLSYDDQWTRTYPPHSLAYTTRFWLYGLGGPGSTTIKDGKDLGMKGILRNWDMGNSGKMKAWLNREVFRRDEAVGKRDAFAVAHWKEYGPADKKDTVGTYYVNDRQYQFVYCADLFDGLAVIDNADTIDGARSARCGYHRGFLRVATPGYDLKLPRTLTIQWCVKRGDRTTGPDAAGSTIRSGWLIETYADPLMPAEARMHVALATGVRIDRHRRVYEATVTIPATGSARGKTLYLRLTPVWVEHDRGETACPRCKHGRIPAGETRCPNCLNTIRRQTLKAVSYGAVSVGAVTVSTEELAAEWLKRLNPRPDHPLDHEAFREVVTRAEADLAAGAGGWPPDDADVFTRTVTVAPAGGGPTAYTVAVASIRGMEARADLISKARQKAHIKARADQLTALLPTADVVLLVATTRSGKARLFEAVGWGEPGAWYRRGAGIESGGSGGADPGADTAASDGDGAGDGDAAAALDTAGTVLTVGHGLVFQTQDVCTWFQGRQAVGLRPGATYQWKAATEATGPDLTADRTITVQKRYAGDFLVQRQTTTVRPGRVEMPSGIAVIDKNHKDVLVKLESERVTRLSDSKIIEEGAAVEGTGESRFASRMQTIGTALDVGATVVTNGAQVYRCSQDGDGVGVALYSLKAGAELSRPILAATRFKSSAWVRGVPLGKAGLKVSVVAVVAGVVETSYYVYRYRQADSDFEKRLLSRQVAACAVDAGIACIEPWGGVVLVSWTVGAYATQAVIYVSPWELTDVARRVTTSPGRGLSILFDHLRDEGVPPDFALEAAKLAIKDAREAVTQLNKAYRDRTVILVGPK